MPAARRLDFLPRSTPIDSLQISLFGQLMMMTIIVVVLEFACVFVVDFVNVLASGAAFVLVVALLVVVVVVFVVVVACVLIFVLVVAFVVVVVLHL